MDTVWPLLPVAIALSGLLAGAVLWGLMRLSRPVTLDGAAALPAGMDGIPSHGGEAPVSPTIGPAVESAPCAICGIDTGGEILWRNAAFRAFSDESAARLVATATHDRPPRDGPLALRDPATGQDRHFDLTVTGTDGHRILYASDVTGLVRADAMRSSFIQTLTKTFADLATGLAVFDRDRRLVLFNPAMIDLTGLPAEFLSARPGLMEFFGRLRDRQVLPEPKDYASWRARINGIIETAAGGRYAEAWSLPGGLTYRITGRPHPDGAIAFLIEDISDEISMSRRWRTQLEIRQAVLDRLDEALVVIGPDSLVILCNRACRDLLGFDPDSSFAETGLDDLVRLCRARFPEDGFWSRIDSGIPRTPLEARLRDGADVPFLVRSEPLPGGFALLTFSGVSGRVQIPA